MLIWKVEKNPILKINFTLQFVLQHWVQPFAVDLVGHIGDMRYCK